MADINPGACVSSEKHVPNLSRGPVELKGTLSRGVYRRQWQSMFRGESARANAQSIKSQIHPAFHLPNVLISPLKASPVRTPSPVGLQGWATIQYRQVTVPKLTGHTPLQTYTTAFFF